MPGKCSFNSDWINKQSSFEKWLRPVDNDKYKALCILCNSKFDVSHSGLSSLKTHEKGKKHSDLLNAVLFKGQKQISFVSGNQNADTLTTPNVEQKEDERAKEFSATKNPTLCNFLINEKVLKAEIIWALNKVMCSLSDRGASKSSDIFKVMFPDSLIAEKFSMQKDKLAYFVSYGLGPYFQNLLCNEVKACDYFCISIDESLNKVSQKGQMDFFVRFWDVCKNEVSTRYLTSAFLGHSTANDLLENFKSCLGDLQIPLNKILQVATDGPNVNLKFLKDLKLDLGVEDKLIDSGTCCLHIIHGAYKTAHACSNWRINTFLRSLYYLFKDFPSRRADFIYYTSSSSFPMKMCSVRWIENGCVIERALKMLPHLKKYVQAVESNPPKSENFEIIKKFLSDELLAAKLSFLQSVISELEPFLVLFQAERPLLPFLHGYYYTIMHSLARRFLHNRVLSEVKNSKQLLSVDVDEINNHVNIKELDVGFGASSIIKTLQDKKVIPFKRECKTFLLDVFKKMVKKSPLSNQMVIGSSCLAPSIMLSKKIKMPRLALLLEKFLDKNVIDGVEADSVKRTYLALSENDSFVDKLKVFSLEKDRLDTFFITNVESVPDSDVSAQDKAIFLKCIKNVFIMFHGNAAVERGFSINKECLVENLHEQSLISQRSIHSAVTSAEGILNVAVTKQMIQYVRNASSKRKEALILKKQKDDDAKNSLKAAQEKIKELKLKRKLVLSQAEEEAEEIRKEIANTEKKLKKS